MTKDELKEQFAIECTTLDEEGRTVVKGTPMDIINWIASKFHIPDINDTLLKGGCDLKATNLRFIGEYCDCEIGTCKEVVKKVQAYRNER